MEKILISLIKTLAALSLLVSLILTSSFAQEADNCHDNESLSQLDFWLGEWNVQNQVGETIGSNSISRILNGCVVEERWVDALGNQGQSWFFVHPASGNLKQIWLTDSALNPGGTKEKEMITFEPGRSIQFQGSYPVRETLVYDRTILTRESNDRVIQRIEISFDEGATWQTNFIGIYNRIE